MNPLPRFVRKPEFLVFVAALVVLTTAWTGLVSPVPTEMSPMPMLTVIPGFLLSAWNYRFAVLLPMVLFLVWTPGLLKGSDKIPRRSLALLLVLTGVSVLWFISGWRYGLQYQGPRYTHAVCGVNVLWVTLLWGFAIQSFKTVPSFGKNLLFHCAVFVWLSWYAFPYLGELP